MRTLIILVACLFASVAMSAQTCQPAACKKADKASCSKAKDSAKVVCSLAILNKF